MIWCWVQAVLLMLAIALSFLVPIAAMFGLLGVGVVLAEQAPRLVRTSGKRIFIGCCVFALGFLLTVAAIKARQKVCAVGFKAAYMTLWTQ